MTPELAKCLDVVFQNAFRQSTLATGVAGVAGVASRLAAPDAGVAGLTRYARKPLQQRQLRPLRLGDGNVGKMTCKDAAAHVAAPDAGVADAIDERAALAAVSVPACYLNSWARSITKGRSACRNSNGGVPSMTAGSSSTRGELKRPIWAGHPTRFSRRGHRVALGRPSGQGDGSGRSISKRRAHHR